MGDQRGTRVYVGNLTDKVKKDDLEGEFTKYGKLNSVWIAFNPPGFAFIEFEHRDDAEKACDVLNGTELLGSQLRVEISKGRPRQGRRGGGGYGDRRGGGGRDYGRRDYGGGGGGYGRRDSSGGGGRYHDRGYGGSSSRSGYGARDGGSGGFSRRDVYGSSSSSGRDRGYGSSGGYGGSSGRSGGGGGSQGGRYRSRSPVGNHRF